MTIKQLLTAPSHLNLVIRHLPKDKNGKGEQWSEPVVCIGLAETDDGFELYAFGPDDLVPFFTQNDERTYVMLGAGEDELKPLPDY